MSDNINALINQMFTTSINRKTFEHKLRESISTYLEETVEIEQVAKPVYNLKASGD